MKSNLKKNDQVKIIAGNYRPSEGSIYVAGERKEFHKPIEARQNGAPGRSSQQVLQRSVRSPDMSRRRNAR